MKPKELYEILLSTGAKIGSVLTTEKATPVEIFIENKADRFIERVHQSKSEDERNLSNEWCDIWTDIYGLGLVKGYIIGQLFDFTDPEILKNIEVIKKELVKEGLFDFLPRLRQSREKKAA
jgi:hypothetical protein